MLHIRIFPLNTKKKKKDVVGLIQALNRNWLSSLQSFTEMDRKTGTEKSAFLGKYLKMRLILTEVSRTRGTTRIARLDQNMGPPSSASCLCQWASRNRRARWRNPAPGRYHFVLQKWELMCRGLKSLPNIQSSLHNFDSLIILHRKHSWAELHEVNQFIPLPQRSKSILLCWAQASYNFMWELIINK